MHEVMYVQKVSPGCTYWCDRVQTYVHDLFSQSYVG